MSLEPNLPRLKPNASVFKPSTAGVWTAENLSLDRLADSLFLPPESLQAADLKSIPDVWAQPLVFQNALRQASHPMHADAVRDWRGLLALLALESAYKDRYQLDLRPVSLAAPQAEGAGVAGRLLREVLGKLPPRTLLPQSAQSGEAPADWSGPVLLRVREVTGDLERPLQGPWQLAGLVNPAVLVSAAKTTAAVRLASAQWAVQGLDDPTRLQADHALPRSEYAILLRYLEELRAGLQTLASGREDDALYKDLVELLKSYAEDARRRADGYDQDKIEAPVPTGVAQLKPLYRHLRRAPRVREGAYHEEYSEAMIALRRDPAESGEPPFKGLLLLDDTLHHVYRRGQRDVHVWRQDTVASLAAPGQRRRIEQQAAAAGYLVVTPADFFTGEFVKLGAGVVAGHDGRSGFANAVLPVSPLALLVFDPKTLQESLKLEARGDGVYAVSLELPVIGAPGPHVITREYTVGGPPGATAEERGGWQDYGIATWPDVAHPDWRWNFLRLASNPNTKAIRPRFGLSARALSRSLALETPASRVDKARAWIDSSACRIEQTAEFSGRVTPPAKDGAPPPPLQRLRYRQEAETVYEVQLSTSPFEAVAIARSPERGAEARPVGLVLLSPGRPLRTGGGAPMVAVDFGTTNTVACVQGRKDPVSFKNRVRPAISNPKLAEEEKALSKWALLEFFPLHDNETPLPTVAKKRVVTPGADPLLTDVIQGDDERPLFSDLVYFQPPGNPQVGQTTVDIEKFAAEKDNLVFDLKWGAGRARDRAAGPSKVEATARRFIRQFMMMTSVELLDQGVDPRRVSWRFSYPEAMRDLARNRLKQAIHASWTELFGGDGQPAIEGAGVRDMTTEGAAAAKYFIDREFPGRLMLIFDIGGGTTDIAVLKDRQLVWRGSFRLAGGDFLTHYVMNNPDFFEGLKLHDFAQLRRGFSEQSSSLYGDRQQGGLLKSFGELLFSDPRFSRAMRDNYRSIEEEESGEGLRHSAYVFLGGLAFYMGLVVRTLVDRGVVGLSDLKHVGFGLGGRGSTFFREFGGQGAGEPLNRLLGCFNQGGGFTSQEASERTELMSERTKLEVVLGMLGDQPRDEALLKRLSERTPSDTPIGETLSRETGEVVAELTVPMAALQSLDGLAYPELSGLQRFLAALTQQVRLKIDLKPDHADGAFRFIQAQVFHGVRANVEDHHAALAEREGLDDGPTLEPAFITGLRALLDRLGAPAAERRNAVAVREL